MADSDPHGNAPHGISTSKKTNGRFQHVDPLPEGTSYEIICLSGDDDHGYQFASL